MLTDQTRIFPRFKFSPSDYPCPTPAREGKNFLQAVVGNHWFGITYLAVQEMESYGMTFATAVETALQVRKPFRNHA